MKKSKSLPAAAIKLIEDLVNPLTYGHLQACGTYAFPLSREYRIKRLQKDFNFVFPIDLPEEYYEKYLQIISRSSKMSDIFKKQIIWTEQKTKN